MCNGRFRRFISYLLLLLLLSLLLLLLLILILLLLLIIILLSLVVVVVLYCAHLYFLSLNYLLELPVLPPPQLSA
jgi:hypothetical protein